MDVWRREAAALARQGLLIARRAVKGRSLAEENDRGVAVFVHGFFAAGPVFDPLRERVERTLGLATLDITYGPHRDFESVAAELRARIDEEVPRDVPIHLVGHSLGGLIARWYLQELGGRARRLVTLATPHGGTTRARLLPGSLGKLLRPDSRWLEKLGDSAGDVPHLVVVGGGDRLVSPESASAVRDARIERFDGLGHNELLYDNRVQRAVVDALADG